MVLLPHFRQDLNKPNFYYDRSVSYKTGIHHSISVCSILPYFKDARLFCNRWDIYTCLALTNRRIFLERNREQVFWFSSITLTTIDIHKIATVSVEQNSLARRLCMGSIRLELSGGKDICIRHIWQPGQIARRISDAITKLRQEQGESTAPPPQNDNHRSASNSYSKIDPYSVLGVEGNATHEEIKQAYRKKMREYHPDKVAQLGSEIRELSERKAKEINDAFESLSEKSDVD